MSETSSIDELLAEELARKQGEILKPLEIAKVEEIVEEISQEPQESQSLETEKPIADEYGLNEGKEVKQESPIETDEYGNIKTAARQYSQEEADEYANRLVRERLARLERNTQIPTPQQQQQAANQGFKYDAESTEDWQQQLAAFTEQVIVQREQRQLQQVKQMKEEQERAEFTHRFQSGMGRFNDFTEVVSSQPITDPMTEALAGIKDPSAFIYAASKRMPQELERISKLPSKAAQMVEMGKLEEKLKQAKPATKAPRPVGRTQEDLTTEHKSKKEPTIEELIAKEDAKRRAMQELKRRR